MDLRFIRERAGQIRTECERITDGVAAEVAWGPALEAVRDAAARVEGRAAEPVRIGVVGEFSAGKTLLLGALLGYADGLPVSEDPTTGNITAVHLVQTAGTATTEFDNRLVSFLTRDEFVECLAYMLESAKERAAKAELSPELLADLKALAPDSGSGALAKIEEWCSRAWDSTANPALRFILRELTAFVRAFHQCGAGLCESGEPFAVDAATVASGLELPKNAASIQELNFADLPTPALSVAYRPAELTASHLQAAFPLVRQVSIDALVSQGVWRFGEVGTRPFALLDFPGLGAESSSVRDLYLSLRELDRIQTILITISSKQPGGDSGSRIYNLLQGRRPGQNVREMVVVAATRFDELPLQDRQQQLRAYAESSPAGGAAKPGKAKGSRVSLGDDEDDDAPVPVAAAPATPPGRAAAFLRDYSVLGTCLSGAEALVPADRADRALLISAMAHVKFLRDKNEMVSVASEAFLSAYQTELDKAAAGRELWAAVAKRLASESPASESKSTTLHTRLAEFGVDGGVGSLRKQLLSHVSLHGREQLLKDVRAVYESDLGLAIAALKRELPASSAPEHALPRDSQQRAAEELRKVSARLMEEKRTLVNAPRLSLPVNDREIDLEDLLTEEVVYRVADWPQWERLFSSVKDGYIDPAAVRRAPDILGPDDDGDDEEVGCPARSEDFYAQFEETVRGLEEFTLGLLGRGVDEWLDRIGRATAPVRQLLDEPLRKPDLAKQLKAMRLGAKGQGLLNALKAVTDPARMKTIFLPGEGGVAALAVTPADPARLFPLARGNAVRVFAWAPANAKLAPESRPDRNLRHLAMVLRLKEEVTAIVLQHTQQLLSEAMQLVIGGQPNPEDGGRDGGMTAGLDAINDRVAFSAGHPLVLDTIFRAGPAPGDDAPADAALGAVERLANFQLTS